MDDEELRTIAKKRLKAKAEFRQFLWIWLGVSALLLAIWATTSVATGHPLYFWPIWPIVGMGIGAFFMGLEAYGPSRSLITEADIDAEVAKLKDRTTL